MATVYLARRGDQTVALKMIREEYARSREFLAMFLDEAKIVARLHHPNIVRTFEQGNLDGQVFIAMELLEGRSLWAVWEACRARGVRLRYDVIAWIGARVAEALHYAHELHDEAGAPLGIVHRDINPSNVFVTSAGVVKVIDFGLAKAANRASRTATGVIKGKIAYMSPEQASGEEVDRRTDVFALGVTLWELACDRRLFKGKDDVHTLQQIRAARVPDPTRLVAGFPPALWSILSGAMARDRDARVATGEELRRQLDAFAGAAVGPAVVAEILRELFAPSGPGAALPGVAALEPVPPTLRDAAAPSPSSRSRGRQTAIVLAVGFVLVVVAIAASLAVR
jgi:serine/threonine protein kinase